MKEICILNKKNIVLGITGSIAAFKAAELTSRLVKAGALVDVIMTEAATHFVGPITFQALTHRPVVKEMFSLLQETDIGHVSLGKRADLMIIAPATANTLAKLVYGLSDNMLTTTALACRSPILLAPAMETGMWENPATKNNIGLLRERGLNIIGPVEGTLASGSTGTGRMVEPVKIIEAGRCLLGRNGMLSGCKVVITAGGTREPLDPVRFLGNYSTGKMGYALATTARDRGAEVSLIHGFTTLDPIYGVDDIVVETAEEMYNAVLELIPSTDILIKAAAVADYRPVSKAHQKIKKSKESRSLDLLNNPDILQAVAEQRKIHNRPYVTMGFAAETEDLLKNAREKLIRKNLDLIAVNDVSAADSGFAVDTNRVTLLEKNKEEHSLPLMSKQEVAEVIFDKVGAIWAEKV